MKNILYILLFLPLAIFGQDNYSLDFNRDDAVFSIENDNIILGGISNNSEFIALSDGYTFECWIKLRGHGWTGNSTAHAYIINGIANGLLINDDNLLHWAFYGSDGTIHRLETPYEFPLNEWRHIAISYENNIAYLFDNGELVESKYIPSGLELNWSADGGFSIGIAHWSNGWWHPIDGEIDNIRISNYARYTNSFCPIDDYSTDENTVLMWSFNEVSDSIVTDVSDNEYNGFLYSVTYSEDVPESNCFGCTDDLATNYDDLAGENDSSCTYNTYPLEDENFKAYLQSNYPQTIVNDSLNINATLGIEDLNVDSLGISSLDGLQYFYDLINLNCVANNLSTLPELPSQIEYINCQWNQIDTLPNFPESLKNFDGRHNLITVVPALPNTMEVLRVCFNEVTTIPELPDSLMILFCAYNYEQLTYLPDFPDHLEEVLCFDNEIEQISDIPETMYKFMMQNNSITQIPNIPEGVNILNLTNNPIECVNDYPEQFEVQLGSYPPCSFLDEYTALMDSLSSVIDSLDITLSNLDDCNTEAINALSSLQLALYNWNTIIDLQEGWNMFGYGCPSPIDVAEGLSNHTESILLVKDNNGSAYIPEWDFNGIGDFTPGFGYQIKLSDAIEGFSLCDWYVNDIPEDNIVTLQEDNYELQEQNLILLDSINLLNQYEVGDFEQGGIIFYIDESGKHGLVAAHHDVSDFVNEWGQQGLNWGCSSIAIDGADGVVVGTGLQNSLDVVSGCQEDLIAASVCLNYVIGSYDDWYLPSIDELYLVLNTIGPFGLNNNLGEFLEGEYLSSTEYSNPNLSPFDVTGWAFGIITNESANPTSSFKGTPKYVRPIRSF